MREKYIEGIKKLREIKKNTRTLKGLQVINDQLQTLLYMVESSSYHKDIEKHEADQIIKTLKV